MHRNAAFATGEFPVKRVQGLKMAAKRRMFLFQAPPPQVIETEEESTRRLGKHTF